MLVAKTRPPTHKTTQGFFVRVQRYDFSDEEARKNEVLSKQKEKREQSRKKRLLPISYLTVVNNFSELNRLLSDDVPTITPKDEKDDLRTNALMMQAKCAIRWRALAPILCLMGCGVAI